MAEPYFSPATDRQVLIILLLMSCIPSSYICSPSIAVLTLSSAEILIIPVSIGSNCQHVLASQKFLELILTFNIVSSVKTPLRGTNIVDLVFLSKPELSGSLVH